ncbi:hypothetical protein ACFYU9_19835 [Streptomyces sp. NPDC004327]|uniref:hypothetical protein n=1 Tax=Streptomyces sp. NPDC004327 TaxID=3364699 RepID=UPI0036A22BAC
MGDYCQSRLCCRCQQRSWTTRFGEERLCGPCAACCRECGRAPAPHVDGLDGGLCAECRGQCGRCGAALPEQGVCRCRRWKRGPGSDPVGFVLQGFPQPLLQALGFSLPRSLHDILYAELAHRTPAQLLDRVERRWHTRWSHALHERDEDDRRRWAPQEIAEFLVGRGPCRNPACEDGHLVQDGAPCPYCKEPEHRFVPGTAETTATDEHARRAAAGIRRALVAGRAARPGKRPGRLPDRGPSAPDPPDRPTD